VAYSQAESSRPLVHVPLYCAHDFSDHDVRFLIELQLVCLESYFAHQNQYDLLVTTNDIRPLLVLLTYQQRSGHRFEVRLVTDGELLSTFHTRPDRLRDAPCMKTIFSKFYPIFRRERAAIVHLDFDTLFMSRVDLQPLLVADIGLVNANQFGRTAKLWSPTPAQSDFFRLEQPVKPVSSWLNSGVFSVQQGGFDLCISEVENYLENLERAKVDGLNAHTDEIILNALAVREKERVKVIPDYHYNFLAYYLNYDPSWLWQGKIVHFHSLKPYSFCSDGEALKFRGVAEADLLSEDLHLAVLLWSRHLHSACQQLAFDSPMLAALPQPLVDQALSRLLAARQQSVETCEV
jgi:hypothetical protein